MQLTCGSAESSKVGSKKLREIYLFSWIQCLETFFASLQGYGLLLSDGFFGGGGEEAGVEEWKCDYWKHPYRASLIASNCQKAHFWPLKYNNVIN